METTKRYTVEIATPDWDTYQPAVKFYHKHRAPRATVVSEIVELPAVGTVAAMQQYAAEWFEGTLVQPTVERDAKGVKTHFSCFSETEFVTVTFRPIFA